MANGIRIDELDATVLPSRDHAVPAMKDGLTVKLTVGQILDLLDKPSLVTVASLADLKALDTNTITAAFLNEEGRYGQYFWRVGDYSAEVATDGEVFYVEADGVDPADGAWVMGGFAEPRTVQEWKASWFGVGSITGDQVPGLQKAVNAYDPALGAVEIKLPPVEMEMNSGALDVPLNLDGKHRLSITGTRDSVFRKGVANRSLIVAGTDDTPVEGLRFRGFTLDGNEINDSSNDWPMLFVRSAKDIKMDDVAAKDGGTGIRVGRGQGTPQSEDIYIQRCTVNNMEFNGIEVFNVKDFWITDNSLIGDAMSGSIENRAIRVLQSHQGHISRNQIRHYGSGIVLNTDAGNPQTDITVDFNVVLGSLGGIAGIWSYYKMLRCKFLFNTVVNADVTNAACLLIGQISGDRSEDIDIIGNTFRVGLAVNSPNVMRVDQVDGLRVKSNTLQHLGTGATANHYAMRFVSCGGLLDIKDNDIEMDGGSGGAFARGIWDISGLASLRFNPSGNTLYMPDANQISQSGSSGTLIGTPSSTNTFITYP